MNQDLTNTAAVILAAGRGTRIGSHLPKVLYPIAGRPMLSYSIQNIEALNISDVYVVTGYRSEDVQSSIGRRALYVYQKDQLGTGHAIMCALNELPPDIDTILVVNGDDSSFYHPNTLKSILETHEKNSSVVSLITAEVKDPTGLGRIIRNADNKIVDIREEKDANKEEKNIQEINVGCYVFSVDWLKLNISKIKISSSGEYYIVDLVKMAASQGKTISSVSLTNHSEWVGVNTIPQLEDATTHMVNRLSQEVANKKVYIFDLDDTLLSTKDLKEEIEKRVFFLTKKVLNSSLSEEEINRIFWDTYNSHKEANSWVSMPEFAHELGEQLGFPDSYLVFKRLFYTLPFENYIKKGVKELLSRSQEDGKVIILATGDYIYQPIKIDVLRNYIDGYHVFEQFDDKALELLSKIYADSQLVFVDDRLSRLNDFKKTLKDARTIHYTDSPYASETQSGFTPDFSCETINKLAEIMSKELAV